MSEFQGPNRRKYVRTDIYAITRYLCPVNNSNVEIQTRISDISEGGVLMLTYLEELPLEALVKLNFVIPGPKGGFMIVTGKVKHTKTIEKDSYQSGIEFVEIAEKDLVAIREYVSSHPPKQWKLGPLEE